MRHCELLPIPPVETATHPAHSAADLRQRWRALMGPLGFGERLLRFAFVGPDRCLLKFLADVEIGSSPNRRDMGSVMSALHTLLADMDAGTTVALLLTRPGRGGVTMLDRQWSSLLTELAGEFDVPLEPIFRANDEALVQVEAPMEAVG
jgi:hypothetical protein